MSGEDKFLISHQLLIVCSSSSGEESYQRSSFQVSMSTGVVVVLVSVK